MRVGYLILVATGCGFQSLGSASSGAPDGSMPDMPIPDGGVSEMHSLGPADFATGQLGNMTFDAARGSLTPNAYTYGGLAAHGRQGSPLWQLGSTSWDVLAGKTVSGVGLWGGEHIIKQAGTVRLDYLGIVNDTSMTIWLEGEVWLDGQAGETFHVAGNDVGFVEIAPPGTTAYVRVAENGTAPVAESGPGWYPVRIGFANGDGTFDFAFTHTDPGGTEKPWTRERMRARASELSGALRTVFFHQILGGGGLSQPPFVHIDDGPLLATTFPDPGPQGVPGDNNNWSARYAAQVYIAQAGSYTLTVNSDDGHRVQFAGQTKNPSWDFNNGTADVTSTITATLPVGWSDLIIDYNQFTGGRKLNITLSGGGLNGNIAKALLRPVEPAGDRLAFGFDDVQQDDIQHTVADNGGQNMPGTAVMPVAAYGGDTQETVTSIDVTYEVVEPHWNDLRFDLESPTKRITFTGRGGIQNGDQVSQTTIPANAGDPLSQLLGGPAAGTWKLDVYDVVDSGGGDVDGHLKSAKLTLHTRGGPDKVARTASWTSAPIDATTRVFGIDSITWDARTADGSEVRVRLATCQHADCSDAIFSRPVTQTMPFSVAPARYLQVRVEMTSDGSHESELRSVAVMLRRDV
jgi:subtilisin-like proprotein convertase family protein